MKNPLPAISDILKWSEIHSIVVLVAICLSLWLDSISLLIFPALISFFYYLDRHKSYLSTLQPYGGYANGVTLLRLLLMCLAGFYYKEWSHEILFVCFTASVLLDVLDGYLARKFNQSSDFGLYFDMETDAFFVALIAIVLFHKDLLEPWLLFPAFLRYFYLLLWKVLPFEPKKEPKRSYASIIAGTFFVTLLLPFILPPYLYTWPLRIAGFLIICSFAISFRFQLLASAAENEVADKTKSF